MSFHNTMGKKHLEKYKERKEGPDCAQLWMVDREETHIHRCVRFLGHGSRHKCNCGAVRDASNRIRLGGGRKRKTV